MQKMIHATNAGWTQTSDWKAAIARFELRLQEAIPSESKLEKYFSAKLKDLKLLLDVKKYGRLMDCPTILQCAKNIINKITAHKDYPQFDRHVEIVILLVRGCAQYFLKDDQSINLLLYCHETLNCLKDVRKETENKLLRSIALYYSKKGNYRLCSYYSGYKEQLTKEEPTNIFLNSQFQLSHVLTKTLFIEHQFIQSRMCGANTQETYAFYYHQLLRLGDYFSYKGELDRAKQCYDRVLHLLVQNPSDDPAFSNKCNEQLDKIRTKTRIISEEPQLIDKLQSLRARLAEARMNFAKNDGRADLILLQRTFTTTVTCIVNEILEVTTLALGKPIGMDFCVVSMGSLAKKEAHLRSDLEFAILYQPSEGVQESPSNTFINTYFRAFVEIFELNMMALGETATLCVASNSASLERVRSEMKGGLQFDEGGHYPFSEKGYEMLCFNPASLTGIITPKAITDKDKKAILNIVPYKSHRMIADLIGCESVVLYALLESQFLYGDEQPYNKFRQTVREELSKPFLKKSMHFGQLLGLWACAGQFIQLNRVNRVVHLKEDVIRIPQWFIRSLSLYTCYSSDALKSLSAAEYLLNQQLNDHPTNRALFFGQNHDRYSNVIHRDFALLLVLVLEVTHTFRFISHSLKEDHNDLVSLDGKNSRYISSYEIDDIPCLQFIITNILPFIVATSKQWQDEVINGKLAKVVLRSDAVGQKSRNLILEFISELVTKYTRSITLFSVIARIEDPQYPNGLHMTDRLISLKSEWCRQWDMSSQTCQRTFSLAILNASPHSSGSTKSITRQAQPVSKMSQQAQIQAIQSNFSRINKLLTQINTKLDNVNINLRLQAIKDHDGLFHLLAITEKALHNNPANIVPLLIDKALAHYMLGNFEQSLDLCAQPPLQAIATREFLEMKSELLLMVRQYTAARNCYSLLNETDALAQKALAMFCSGRFQEADHTFSQALQKSPSDMIILVGKAFCNLQKNMHPNDSGNIELKKEKDLNLFSMVKLLYYKMKMYTALLRFQQADESISLLRRLIPEGNYKGTWLQPRPFISLDEQKHEPEALDTCIEIWRIVIQNNEEKKWFSRFCSIYNIEHWQNLSINDHLKNAFFMSRYEHKPQYHKVCEMFLQRKENFAEHALQLLGSALLFDTDKDIFIREIQAICLYARNDNQTADRIFAENETLLADDQETLKAIYAFRYIELKYINQDKAEDFFDKRTALTRGHVQQKINDPTQLTEDRMVTVFGISVSRDSMETLQGNAAVPNIIFERYLNEAPEILSFAIKRLIDLRQYELALQCCEHAISVYQSDRYHESPDYSEHFATMLYFKGYLIFTKGDVIQKINGNSRSDQLKFAADVFSESLVIEPRSVFSCQGLALCKYKSQPDESVRIFREIDYLLSGYQTMEHEIFELYSARGDMLVALNALAEARRAYEDAQQICPRVGYLLKEKFSLLDSKLPVHQRKPSIRSNRPRLLSLDFSELNLGKKIGKGSFGKVYEATSTNQDLLNKPLAVKKMIPDCLDIRSLDEFKREVGIHTQLSSPFIISIYGVTTEKPYCIIMELADRGSLRTYLAETNIHDLSWERRIQFACDISGGIEYLHSRNILHSDLKSLNILLTNQYRAKLADFGLAVVKAGSTSQYLFESSRNENKPKGTNLWLAPELFTPKMRRTRCSDMYSFGVVLWEIASHMLPYQRLFKIYAMNLHTFIEYVQSGNREVFNNEITPNTPVEYQSIATRCWSTDPKMRLTATDSSRQLECIKQTFFASRLAHEPSQGKAAVKSNSRK